MAVSRTSSVDLHLEVDLGRPRQRRAALEAALRAAIRTGRLPAGAPLPSSRGLAGDLGVGRGTVVEAYGQLVAEGYLVTRPGGRTSVATTVTPFDPPEPPLLPAPTAAVDLRPGLLDLSRTFPRSSWLRASRSVLTAAPDGAFDYADPRGRPELRRALSSYLGRARGVVATPEQVVICAGFTSALSLLCTALRARGATTVAMEDPCLPAHRAVVRTHDLVVHPLPVDDRGAAATSLPGDADAVVVTPAHQYPTGVTLDGSRRAAMVEWARRGGGLIIEDDYDGEFRFDRQPVGALQGLAPDHVVYVGTASKTLAPGVRIGWLVLPAGLVEAASDLQAQRGSPPALDQLVLARLIDDATIDRHLRRLRGEYRRRRDALIATLRRAAPGLEVSGIAAGLHVLVRVTEQQEAAVRAAANEHDVALAYLSDHHHRGHGPRGHGIVIGYARQPPHRFGAALDRLASVLSAAG